MKFEKLFRIVVLSVAVISTIAVSFLLWNSSDQIFVTPNIVYLNDGWTMTLNGTTKSISSPEDADIPIMNENDTVSISRKLEDFGLSETCLSFYSILAIVRVYLDDEIIYSFGEEYAARQTTIPKRHHHIRLDEPYAGKTLTIEFVGSRKRSFANLSEVYVGTRSDVFVKESIDAVNAICIGYFLLTLGIILIVLSPYLFLYHNKDLKILFSGLIAVTFAIYILAFHGVFDMIINNPLLNTVLEFGALYNIPTALAGYLMTTYSGKAKKLFIAMFIIDIGLFITSIILHIVHAARFSDFTAVLHIASAIEAAISFIILAQAYWKRRNEPNSHIYSSDNLFIVGLVAFISLGIVDVIRYNIRLYGRGAVEGPDTLLFFSFGALFFVTCLLLSYFFYNIYSTRMDTMESKIKSLAYSDTLTGLSNRARCEQMLATLTEEHGTYAIISLDVNRLKYVNDTLGHHEGDRLITGFSTILSDCFWDANLIGRMGGDEFIVILMEDRTLNVTKRIHELYAMISDWNLKEQMFKYSAAYGYAYSSEVPSGSAQEVYMLADNRMYEMKREQHENEDKEVIANA